MRYNPKLAEIVNREVELEGRAGARKKNRKAEPPKIAAPANSQEGYIFVPSLGMDIAKKRTLQGIDFYEQTKSAHAQSQRICTINEFREFVNYLRNGYSDRQEAQQILDEIYKVEGNWRAENLDARFEKVKKDLFVNYHKFDDNGDITPVRERVAPCLMENKTPGISLDDWLANATPQGLPLENVNSGDLYYWAPVNEAVAWFYADSVRAYLNCSRSPTNVDSSLGVRLVGRKKISGGENDKSN